MLKKRFILGIIFAGVLALLGGGRVFAVSGNTATISGGKTWEICVSTGTDYKGSAFVANITKSGFESQVVFGDFEQQSCKNVKLAAGDYTVSLNKPMGAGETSYEIIGSNKLVFTIASVLNKYFNSYGSVNYEMEGSGGTTFPTVFAIEGECTFHGDDSNITGSTCIDSDGHDWTDSKYIDTNVALFRKDNEVDNASKDFEVYFEIVNWESSQTAQATLFNAKLEDASVYYPGFVMRIRNNANDLELTSRQGVNSSTDKKSKYIATSAASPVKIVRKNGVITYSFGGSEPAVLDDFSSFSRFFDQTAVFGASKTSSGAAQRIYKGTLRNMYIKLGKIEAPKHTVSFGANGGTGSMNPLVVNEDEATPITANSFTRENYAFKGWNTKADGSGTAYADGADITVSAAMGDTTLYAQWVQATTTTLKIGQNVNAALKALANGSSVSYATVDTLIKNLSFVDTLPSTVDENTPRVNIALDGEIPVYAYWVANDEAIYINTEADTIYANQGSSYMFNNMQSLTSLTLPDSFDTSNVTDMRSMFYNMQALTSLTLPASFDTSNATKMGRMFAYMYALTSLTLPASFDTSNVTDMNSMFYNMYALTSLTLPASFDTSKVTDMGYMFGHMQSLTSLTLPASFDTSKVTNMYGMFYSTKALTSLTLPASFDTSKVTDMGLMFGNMQSLTSLTLPDSFDTSSVTNMRSMFSGMSALTSLTLPDSFDTSNVTDMNSMFYNMYALTSLTLPDSFDTSNVTDMQSMFSGMQALASLTLPASFNTPNVTNMDSMFYDMQSLTSLTLPASFDTSSVTNMRGMFYSTKALTSLTLPDSFDTSNVTDMQRMFSGMQALTSLTLPASFDTSNVTDMNSMFYNMYALTSLTLPDSFDTSKVTDMGYMFYNMQSLTSLTVPDSFVIASGTTTAAIFSGIRRTATMHATDATVRSLWPGVLGN